MVRKRNKTLTQKDHKQIGRLLSRGWSFDRARQSVENPKPTPTRKHHGGFHRDGSGIQGSLSQVHDLLQVIAIMLELLGVLGILASYGFGFAGIFVTSLYLAGWELIGWVFDSAGARVPRPFKILWEILEDLFDIFV